MERYLSTCSSAMKRSRELRRRTTDVWKSRGSREPWNTCLTRSDKPSWRYSNTLLHDGSSVPKTSRGALQTPGTTAAAQEMILMISCLFFFFKVSLLGKQTADFNVKVMGFPVSIHCPGPEEELGWAAPWVPGPFTRHRHLVKEGPQGAPGSSTEAAGDRHQPSREVPDRLHTHHIGL